MKLTGFIRLFFVSLLSFTFIYSTDLFSAEVEITISKQIERKIRLTLLPFYAQATSQTEFIILAKEIYAIAEFDFNHSGFFQIWPEEKLPEKALEQGKDFDNLNFDFWLDYGTEMVAKSQFEITGDKITIRMKVFDMASRAVIFEDAVSGPKSSLRSVVHTITGNFIEKVSGRSSITNSRIAFVAQTGKAKNLYLMDYDGYNTVQFTFDDSINIDPSWKPDGSGIFYMSYIQTYPFIYLKKINADKINLISGKPGLNAFPAVSPDGQKIACTLSFNGNPEIYVIDLYGNVLKRVTWSPSVENSPTWAPDNQTLAFVSDISGTGRPQIYVKNYLAGDDIDPRRITFSGNYNSSPDWSPIPGSSIIVYTSLYGRNSEICIVDANTGDYRRVTTTLESEEDPSWAPDGIHVSYTLTQNYRSEIYFMDIRDAVSVKLTAFKNNCSSSAWGPSYKKTK